MSGAPPEHRRRAKVSPRGDFRDLRRLARCRISGFVWRATWLAVACFLLLGGQNLALAQTQGELTVGAPPDLSAFAERPLAEVRVVMTGKLWRERVEVQSVRPGDIVTGAMVRRGLRELDRSGMYAELSAQLVEEGGRLILVYRVRPQRIIDQIRVEGRLLDSSDERRALGIAPGAAVTDEQLAEAEDGLREFYVHSGYREARVVIRAEDVDDPRLVLLRVEVTAGQPQEISVVRFRVAPSPHHPALQASLKTFGLEKGDRLDAQEVVLASESLVTVLVEAGFYEARVEHRILPGGVLEMLVSPGPRFSVRIEGNETFGGDELEEALELVENRDPRPELLLGLVRDFYVQHGYLDAHVEVTRLDSQDSLRSELVVWVREGARFRIARREYPCLTGHRDAEGVGDEIDGVLSERFPPVGVVGPVSATAVDEATGTVSASPRPTPWQAEPWSSFADAEYREVMNHLRDLYRAEGYLGAEVGAATVVRRRCLPESPPGECLVEGPPPYPVESCSLHAEREVKVNYTCVPKPEEGVRCEADATLVLPILPGPQTILYDVAIEGNQAFSEQQLLKFAELSLGQPLRRAQLEGALRRIQDAYLEEAFAFAQIDSDIELSPDSTRARLVISITERQQVRISRIEVRGATDTSETLIRSRLSVLVGDLYRRSAVTRSEEQLESLGVFTSVTLALQDPGVPAREKVVVVTLVERLPQYLDTKGGFGTADGFRLGFEYGHRNLGGEAIQFVLRSQLSLLPTFLITEQDVREKYERDLNTLLDRLARRNTITLAFPDVGLGPLFRFEVELLDLHANQRDFSQTRDSGALRLIFLPRRQYLVQLGGTVELNEVTILETEVISMDDNPVILVPEGRSVAFTQNLSASWDRRDKPLAATRGTYLTAGVEHVTALPLEEQELDCAQLVSGDVDIAVNQVCSEFLKFTGRVAGYIPLSKKGLTFALSLRAGVIQHLTDVSRTYPDRLFFMGGVDTLRGYPQNSLVPQDLADKVLDGEISIEEVALRGGDIFMNPRAELRIPITSTFQTALFLDAGNLWYDRSTFNPLKLRYTLGSGLRIQTPVGPLVFDYGFNLERLAATIAGNSDKGRSWEQIGAFHFSIGLF